MDPLSGSRKKHNETNLQLTSLIDIISLIIIFLIMGSFFGGADIFVPSEITIPKSKTKTEATLAPSIIIKAQGVTFSLQPDVTVPFDVLQNFSQAGFTHPTIDTVKKYLASVGEQQKAGGLLLSIIADQNADYEKIFQVSLVFRKLGFTNLNFITDGGP